MWTNVAKTLFHGCKTEAPWYGFFVDLHGKGKLFSIFLCLFLLGGPHDEFILLALELVVLSQPL